MGKVACQWWELLPKECWALIVNTNSIDAQFVHHSYARLDTLVWQTFLRNFVWDEE